MMKKLLFAAVAISIIFSLFASALIVPVQSSQQIEAADPTPAPVSGNDASDGDLIDYSEIQTLEWAGPGGPGTYEEYTQSHEQFQPQASFEITPLDIFPFSAATNAVTPPGVQGKGKIIFVVNRGLYPEIEARFDRYAADAQMLGYETETYVYASGTAEELKSYIVNHAQDLTGCIFIGSMPAAWYEIEPSDSFPCDLFYMDLDGTWTDTDLDGKYDSHSAGSGDVNPEIFVARIDASKVPGDEAAAINSYFDKLHSYYIGATQRTMYGLTYTEDSWAGYFDIKNEINRAYTQYEAIVAPNTSRNDYRNNRLTSAAYDLIQLACHSSSGGHAFTRGGWLTTADVRSVPPEALFYNLFACGSLRFTDPDCLGNAYIFNPGGRGLAVVGSTKSGSMLVFRNFYAPLGEGKSFGEAFKEWFDSLAPYSNDEISWHYGMCILGDPLVEPLKDPPSNTLTITSNPIEGGSTSGSGSYYSGSIVTISAIANSGYHFVNWTGDIGTIANPESSTTTITMNGNYSVQANFVPGPTQYLTISSSTGGTVSKPGIGCFSYPQGSIISLSAISYSCGYQFTGWSGDTGTIANPGSANTTITINGDYTIQANFIFSATNGWQVENSGSAQFLSAVWPVSPNNVFAVGDQGTILHYDGSSWSKMDSPATESLLVDIFGSSPSDIFTVGDSGTILHYDGSSWQAMSSPVPLLLLGVWSHASDDAFAVGYDGTILHYDGSSWTAMNSTTSANLWDVWGTASNDVFVAGEGVILHFDGSSWQTMISDPDKAFCNMWGSSHNNIFVVGAANINDNPYGIIMHYDGSSWNPMTINAPDILFGIWGSASSNIVYASGGNTLDANGIGHIYKYDGLTWSEVCDHYQTPFITDLGGPSIYDMFAVAYDGTILHYRDTSEAILTVSSSIGGIVKNPGIGSFSYPKGTTVNLAAVPASCGYQFTGWSGDNGTIANPNAANTTIAMYGDYTIQANFIFTATPAWKAEDSGITNFLSAVWSAAPDNAFAVGELGTILHYDGSSWTPMISNTEELLVDIWGNSPNDIFTVGDSGTILHYNGTSWTPMISGASGLLLGVWARSSNDVFAVGDSAILHYDGSSWSTMYSDPILLTDVWGSAANDVFAVGPADNGFDGNGNVILHYNGSGWTQMTSASDKPLWDLWGSAPNDVFAIGAQGTILHYNGSSWSQMISNTADQLFGIYGFAPNLVYAVGGNDLNNWEFGNIYRYDGITWSEVCDHYQVPFLTDIGGSSQYNMFAMSSDGNILHYSEHRNLTVSSSTGGTVTTPGIGNFSYIRSTNASIIATPNSGYDFANWSGDNGSIANPNAASTTITMNGNYSIKANFTTIPNAPSNLVATAVSTTQINLTWQDNSNHETGFKIERKTGAGGTYAQITTVGANVTAYSNTGLTLNTTYYYRVRSYSAAGNSSYCVEKSATTLPAPPPVPTLASPANAATGLNVTPRLSWNPSTGAVRYSVQVSTVSTFATTVINQTGVTSTYFDVPGGILAWNTRYYWRVNAVGPSGSTSAWSTSRYFNTASVPPPADPSNLTATAVSSSQINLTWQDNSNNETGFKIERKTGAGGTYAQIATVGANVAVYNNTGLTANTIYYYRVRSYNAPWNSNYCAEKSATTAPAVPTLSSPANGATGLNLTPRLAWSSSTGAVNYSIQVSTVSTFATTVINQGRITTTYFDVPAGKLGWNTRYYWRVNAVGPSGSTSAWSTSRYFNTKTGP